MVFNLALMPDVKLSEGIVGVSTEVSDQVDNRSRLGESALPHVTVAQFEAPESDVMKIARKVGSNAGALVADLELVLAGLAFIPDPAGETWIEIPVLKCKQLSKLQSKCVKVIEEHGGKIVSGTGDGYRPHATVGLIDGGRAVSLTLDHRVLRAAAKGWVLAIGESGANYSYARTVCDVSAS